MVVVHYGMRFSHLLIRGLIKALSPNYAIFSTFTIAMYHFNVHDSSTSWEEFSKSIFKFSHLLIRGLIKGLTHN